MKEKKILSYYSDATRNYLVLECPPDLKDNYQYRMLAANRIRGLLDCSGRTIDGREYLYYDITSRQSLADLFDRRPVRGADLERILESLFRVEERLTEYLLDTSHLIPDPACIFMDFRGQDCSFVYYPGDPQEGSGEEPQGGAEEEKAGEKTYGETRTSPGLVRSDGWSPLFTFLADRVDGTDKRAAALIYRLCMMAERPGFRLRADLLDELGIHIRKEKGSSMQEGRDGRPAFGREPDGAGYRRGMRDGINPWTDPYGGETNGQNLRQNPYGGEGSGQNPRQDPYGRAGYDLNARPDQYGKESNCGNPDLATPVADEAGTEHPAGRVRGVLPAVVLLAAGIIFFSLHYFIEIPERETLLTYAAGGVFILCGIAFLILQLVTGRREKTEKKTGQETGPVYRETYAWEVTDAPVVSGGIAGPAGAAFSGTGTPFSPYAPQEQGFGLPSTAPHGETCLLGPDTGMNAALYGTGTCRGDQISLSSLPCVVGKYRDYVDQVIDDSSVSRMHVRFALDCNGKMTVKDLNSTNGTWVNGERLAPNEIREIRQGDHLRLGRLEYVYR